MKLAVLSDLHISPPGPLSSFHAGPELADLLKRLRTDHAISSLVLAGDIFDFLALPFATPTLDPCSVPARIEAMLGDLAQLDWGEQVFRELGVLARHGTQIIILPGNHDPELGHPAAEAITRKRIGLADTDEQLLIRREATLWSTRIGDRDIIVGHGHRGDTWNDIDPAVILHHATANPPRPVELPLGSRLVVGAMRAFREKYSFVDALKPEMPGVPLLLLYLDPTLAAKHLPGVATLSARAWIAGLQRRLTTSPTLGVEHASPATAFASDARDVDMLAAALLDALDPADRTAHVVGMIEDSLLAPSAPAAGSLSTHSGARYLLRAALRWLSRNGTAFDTTRIDAADKAIIAEHLPDGCPPRVVIAGHTHAARHIRIDEHRTYLNTGTWSDLIPWPPLISDQQAKTFIDELEAGAVLPVKRLTWALIDEQRTQLLDASRGDLPLQDPSLT